MKKIMGYVIAITLLLAAGSTATFAQGYLGGYGSRLYLNRQIARINQGIRSGELTRNEASRLQSRVYRLYNYERNAMADGDVDWRERRWIDQERSSLNRAIFRESNDRQDRDRWDDRYDRYDRNDRWNDRDRW